MTLSLLAQQCGLRRFVRTLGVILFIAYSARAETLSAAEVASGQLNFAGRDPAAQIERDWVDNRWSRTEIGQFLASSLEVFGVRIAKGLSIKVGDNADGTVCYDTRDCTFRAAWLGGFLQLDPARFGLIRSPRIAGDITLDPPSGTSWQSTSNRYIGLHVHGTRVVLEYSIDDVRVLDSPWLVSRDNLKFFSRSLELAPCKREMKLALAAGGADAVITDAPFRAGAIVGHGSNVFAVSVFGADVKLANENGKLVVGFPAHKETQHVKLLFWVGNKAALRKFDECATSISETENLSALLEPGPARWLPELKTVGQRGLDTDILAVDTLTVPYDNPWKALMFL